MLVDPQQRVALIFGETRLSIQCIEYLIANNWIIKAIITEDELLRHWAGSNFIKCLPFAQLAAIHEENCYLFSIISPHIIPDWFMEQNKVILALNYHDSLLPKYAGVNSTTWAILNNEKVHGITIHQITSGIDEGDITGRVEINIQEDETALSLNLKCSVEFLLLFQEIILKIQNNTLTFIKQDLATKTYYGWGHIPDNYAIINGLTDPSYLNRLSRSLTFGNDYANLIATVKININGEYFILEDFNYNLNETDVLAGRIDDSIFKTVKDIYGHAKDRMVSYADLANPFYLTETELNYLKSLRKSERKVKSSILNFFATIKAPLAICEGFSESNSFEKYKEIVNYGGKHTPTSLLAYIYIILARYFHEDFIISLYSIDNKIPENLRKLIDARNFIHVSKDQLPHGFKKLNQELDVKINNAYPMTKDFGYRYHLNLLTDIAVVFEGDDNCIDKHKIIFSIQSDCITITGTGYYQLQIANIAKCLSTLINEYTIDEISNIDLRLINILNKRDYKKIIYEWNNTKRPYPKDKTIHQLFEEQVEKTPNNIAVVYEDTQLTYRELNNQANRLAAYLINNYRINHDQLILLCLDRSEYLPIVLLAVLKSGGAYVPIDPKSPHERIEYILKDTKAEILITNEKFIDRFNHVHSLNLIAVDSNKFQFKLVAQTQSNPKTRLASSNLAYAIYTSGTTGKPKGVLIEHKSVVNLLFALQYYLFNKINYSFKCLWFASYAFDAHVLELYSSISFGYSVYIASNIHFKNFSKLNEFINRNKIDIALIPPSILTLTEVLNLNTLIVGGEMTNTGIIDLYHKSKIRVFNAYGPTEDTVCTTLKFCNESGYNNIGRPLFNKRVYILDENMQPVPIGAIGELFITGEGLARGYLNRPDLNDRCFITHKFNEPTQLKNRYRYNKLYKTGDLVRYLADGSIEYIGRNDSQVKLRGYRIELKEIETLLASFPNIKQAIVVINTINSKVKDSANNYLVGYYVSEKKLDENEINAYLSSRLPEYMLPTALVHITSLPLTINGKIDKKALPMPNLSNHNYLKPRNEIEDLICKAFSIVLGQDAVGIDDDFFKLGGNSILAIKLISSLQNKYEININQIFMLKTPRKLAEIAIKVENNLLKKLEQVKLIIPNLVAIRDKYKENQAKNQYLEEAKKFTFKQCNKLIKTVLLTGATGYLGCHILWCLLNTTNYIIYLLIRADSKDEAYEKLASKFCYYFNQNINIFENRIIIFASYLEQKLLNLSASDYHQLVHKVDSIIHCAALVKYYGTYREFYEANVCATINLLELALETSLKDFQYVSTTGVFMDGYVPGCEYYLFHEDSDDNILQSKTNIYIKTKAEGEKVAIRYRNFGVNTNIIRVGNLFSNTQTYKLQENISDSAFYMTLKTMLKIGIIPKELANVEISPVDYTASAIVKIFDQQELINQCYHVFNPELVELTGIFNYSDNVKLKIDSFDKFLECLQSRLDMHELELFMLHQKWIQNINFRRFTAVEIMQNKTSMILKKLGFTWPKITREMLTTVIEST